MPLGSSESTSEVETKATPLFARFARWVERQVGRSSTFVLAIAVVLLWAVSGPLFGWSDTWQLVINTGTTIVTFLMVFVIQNTQSCNYLHNGCGTTAVGAFSPRAARFSSRRSRYLAGQRWRASVGRVQHSIPCSLADNPAEAA